MIILRKNPTIKLSNLRAQDLLLEINEQDLSFTKREIKKFFNNSPLVNDKNIHNISSVSGGWVDSLVLLRYTFSKHSPDDISESLQSFKQAPQYIFAYLKENIFDLQPEPVKDFMMKAALLPEVDVQLCQKIFHVKNAEVMLNKMIEDHLMIFPVDDTGNVFYLHRLFKDFLITQFKANFTEAEIKIFTIELHVKLKNGTFFWL